MLYQCHSHPSPLDFLNFQLFIGRFFFNCQFPSFDLATFTYFYFLVHFCFSTFVEYALVICVPVNVHTITLILVIHYFDSHWCVSLFPSTTNGVVLSRVEYVTVELLGAFNNLVQICFQCTLKQPDIPLHVYVAILCSVCTIGDHDYRHCFVSYLWRPN